MDFQITALRWGAAGLCVCEFEIAYFLISANAQINGHHVSFLLEDTS